MIDSAERGIASRVPWLLATLLIIPALASPAQARKILQSKIRGKVLWAVFEQKLSECTNPNNPSETWQGFAFAQVSYIERVEKKDESGLTVTEPDVYVTLWRSDPCNPVSEFQADGCTTVGPRGCWSDPVYATKTIKVDAKLQSGSIVANVPLYGVSNGCGYSAEVSLNWVATTDKRIAWNGTYHYYGFETEGGPLIRYDAHTKATVQPAHASGSLKVNGWRNLDGTLAQYPVYGGGTSLDPCNELATLPSNWALSNVLWDKYDSDHVAPWTSIQESSDTDYRTTVQRVLPKKTI